MQEQRQIVVTDARTVVGGGVTLDFLQKYGQVQVYDLTPSELVAERTGRRKRFLSIRWR